MTKTMLGKIDWQPLFEDHGISLALMGFVVVFAALLTVRVFIGLLPRIIAVLDHYYPEQEKAYPSPARQEARSEGLPDEIVAVIAATVAVIVRVPHRIVRTRELSSENMSWPLAPDQANKERKFYLFLESSLMRTEIVWHRVSPLCSLE
ncbi:MAG: OadG family transporter subunit, partial [Pirellulales bacterium]